MCSVCRPHGFTGEKSRTANFPNSDYWSLAVTPAQEVLCSVLDVLTTEQLRYRLSKECVLAGAGEYGRVQLSGFDPKMQGDSLERLVAHLNDTSNQMALPQFKSAILEAYRKILVARGGIPGQLFDISPCSFYHGRATQVTLSQMKRVFADEHLWWLRKV